MPQENKDEIFSNVQRHRDNPNYVLLHGIIGVEEYIRMKKYDPCLLTLKCPWNHNKNGK